MTRMKTDKQSFRTNGADMAVNGIPARLLEDGRYYVCTPPFSCGGITGNLQKKESLSMGGLLEKCLATMQEPLPMKHLTLLLLIVKEVPYLNEPKEN